MKTVALLSYFVTAFLVVLGSAQAQNNVADIIIVRSIFADSDAHPRADAIKFSHLQSKED